MPHPISTSAARHLQARAARAQRDSRAPGLVVGLVRDGGLLWSTGRGDVAEPHADVQHRIGSITKTITALAVLRLRDAGRLHLDDRLEQHLPGTPLGDRTLAQLLSHTSGAAAESPGQWWERTPGGSLADLGLDGEVVLRGPGRRFHYSNLGFGLLGELLAQAHGRSWDEVVREQVLLPLGMSRTNSRPQAPAARGWGVHPWADVLLPEPEEHHGAMAPAGQLWSSLEDLARLAAFLLSDGTALLAPGTLEEMCVPVASDVDEHASASYGLGLQVFLSRGVHCVGHGGSMPGFLAGLMVDRSTGDGVVGMRNATSGSDGGMFGDLLDLLAEHEPAVGPAWAPQPPPVPLDVLGPWYWGPAPYALRAVADRLLHLDGLGRPGRASRFRPQPDGTWLGLDGYFAGETMTLTPHLMTLATFVFTRTPYDPAQPVPGGVDPRGWR